MGKYLVLSDNAPLRFTVVTPNLNLGKYLPATIESVLSNLEEDDEYFVIDGGSSDDSTEVLRRYADRLSGWISEPDRSYGDAIAKGFNRGTGELFCWINSGDVLLPGALRTAKEAFAQRDVEMIFGDDLYIDENNKVLQYSVGQVSSLRNYMLYGGWTPLQDACFWRSELYRRVGGLNPDLRYAADYDLFVRMAVFGKTQYMPKVFSAFRKHEGQKSISGSEAYARERREVQRSLYERLSYPRPVVNLLRAWYAAVVRWRLRVLHRLNPRPALIGRSVNELSCQSR